MSTPIVGQTIVEQQQLEEQQRLQEQQRLEEQQRLQEQQHLEQQEKEYLRQQQLHQQQLHEQQIQEQIRQQQLQQQMMQEQQLQAEQLQQQPDDKPEDCYCRRSHSYTERASYCYHAPVRSLSNGTYDSLQRTIGALQDPSRRAIDQGPRRHPIHHNLGWVHHTSWISAWLSLHADSPLHGRGMGHATACGPNVQPRLEPSYDGYAT